MRKRSIVDAADKIEEALRRYRKSEKGKEALRRYLKSEKGKEALRRYRQSEKYKAAVLRYRMSEKGQQARQRARALYLLANRYQKWLEENPGKGVSDFLESEFKT